MLANSQMSTFVVSPDIIYSLIKSQAGSLAKAVLECIMNSVDAKATEVHIQYDPDKIIIQDNGKGFTSVSEIKECFNVFGFDHSGQERTYGEFGIGRAQMWNFCSTIWRTNTFSMDVDIKNKGLDYEIKEKLDNQPGLEIIGKFYYPKSITDLNNFHNELMELAKYAQVQVYLNGKLINKDPSKIKWKHETHEAWFDLKEYGELNIYNLGVKVKSFRNSYLGCGGTIVTKPNIRLILNMARNDIIVSDCLIWNKITKDVQKKSNSLFGKETATKTLSHEKIINIISQILNGTYSTDIDFYWNKKIIPTIQNRKISLSYFASKITNYCFSIGPKSDIILEKSHTLGDVFVFNESIYELFNVDNIDDLVDKMKIIAKHYKQTTEFDSVSLKYIPAEDLRKNYSSIYNIIPKKEYTEMEKVAVSCLTLASKYLTATFQYVLGEKYKRRTVRIGVSDTAQAWTDGESYIAFNKDVIKEISKGFIGISRLVHILAHEYIHKSDNSGSHNHDIDFYNTYHDITMHDNFQNCIRSANKHFIRECLNRGIKINKVVAEAYDDTNDDLIENCE